MLWLTYALAALGAYALCWWLLDNLRSVVEIVVSLLRPFFQPQDERTLVQRFGEWAGNNHARSRSELCTANAYRLGNSQRVSKII